MPPKDTDFRTALQVSPEVISNLTDTGLTALMRALLHDHSYRCGAPVSEVRVNTEEKAADDGCDAWSPAPLRPDQWFGDSAACWQLKAGVAGQPAKLTGEITKPIPADTLKKGGRVVLVASGSTNGAAGERDRLRALQGEATAAGLPTNRIDVIGSERLTVWCNQHPAVAARFSGAPEGLWLLDQWSALPVHHAPWQPTAQREAELAKMRAELDFSAKGFLHLHIQGRPGVGKSRFALELCKGAAWNGSVVYVRDASDLPVQKIIQGAVAQPRNGPEVLACVQEAIGRLTKIALSSGEELQVDLVKAAQDLSMLLREDDARDVVADFYFAIREKHPATREALRRIVADILYREEKYWKQLPPEALAKVTAIHAAFEEQSLEARLRQRVGPGRWEKDEDKGVLEALAGELVADRPSLEREWPWLTSGNAGDAWDFGEAMAVADAEGKLDDVLVALDGRGPDLRTLCGFVSKRRDQRGAPWFDAWTRKTFAARPGDWPLLFELGWRCGVTATLAGIISAAVREKEVPEQFTKQLENGAWPSSLPLDALKELLEALCSRGHERAAVAVLEHRLKAHPGDLDTLEALALQVVTSSDVIRHGATMTDYYWKEVAFRLAPRHAQAIVAAIFREQADRTSETWFAEYSTAKEILWKCVEVDPAAVWQAFIPHLSSMVSGFHFAVGFPLGLLDRMPAEDVCKWVEEKPEERASIVARLVNKSLINDETLTARILGRFGDDDIIGNEFFAAYVSGSWTGPTSQHWGRLAGKLEGAAQTTKLPKLRRWAADYARRLREMQERDAQREEEEDVRGR